MRNSLSGIHPLNKLIFTFFIILSVFLIFIVVGLVLALPIFKIGLSDLSKILSDSTSAENILFLKYLQTLQAIGLFIVPAFIIGYFFHTRSLEYLKLTRRISIRSILLVVFILIVSVPIINYFAVLNKGMELPESLSRIEEWMRDKENAAQAITKVLLKMDSVSALMFNIFMIGVLPSIGEELIFRGIIQRIFSEWTKKVYWGIIIAAFFFSAMHFQFYGFLPRFILGVLLGYLFYWSGSMWVPIIGHFVNNASAVLVYYLNPGGIDEEIENFGATSNSYLYLIPSFIFIGILLYMFYKQRKN